jgi:nickel-dependent lactate racemase
MIKQMIRILTNAWYRDEEMELQFPGGWEVQESRMAGHNTPPLSEERILECLQKPLGTRPLKEMAVGKKQVVIIFDDLARPSPTSKIIPSILQELHKAGIQDDQIRFVAASATHAAMHQEDFVKKLGRNIVTRFHIYSHNPYENLVDVGKTSSGIPIFINREVMECDFKISIGTLTPHESAGFSGGAKIILPGVAGIDTVYQHHSRFPSPGADSSIEKNSHSAEGNPFRKDIEEAARMAGLDFNVDLVVNNRREIIGVFAGDFIQQHRAGSKYAKSVYTSPIIKECDIVVANAYPMENQMKRSAWPGKVSLKKGGIFVVISQGKGGPILHNLSGRFGTHYGGRLWRPPPKPLLSGAERLLICSSYISRTELDEWGSPDETLLCKTWKEVLGQLTAAYLKKAKVAVYPYAPLQIPEEA